MELVVGIVAPSVSTWPLFVGIVKELFIQVGVAVEIEITHNSARHMDALQNGSVHVGDQLADHVIRAVSKGVELAAVIAIDRPHTQLIVRPEYRGFEDLRGHELAVDGTATGYALVLRRMLDVHGIRV